MPNANGPIDVLDVLFSQILEHQIETITHLFIRGIGNAHAARPRQGFEARRNIDPVALDVVTVDNDITEIYAHPKHDLLCRRFVGVTPRHFALNVSAALDRIDDAGKLYQNTIAHKLDEASAMFSDFWIDQLFLQSAQSQNRAFLIGSDQACVADDIRSKYGG